MRVELTLEADYIFADVVPGAPDGTVVTASATATAVPVPLPESSEPLLTTFNEIQHASLA